MNVTNQKHENVTDEISPDTRPREIAKEGKLNEVITRWSRRKNNSLRVQQDFEFCPTLAEQHTAHLSDINYLIEKFKPDELQAYIQARTQHRTEILGHDFSREPNLQESKNIIYESKKAYSELPEEITNQFSNHLEFLKFIDNPSNAEKMVKLGLLKPKQIQQITGNEPVKTTEPTRTPTQEKDDKAK